MSASRFNQPSHAVARRGLIAFLACATLVSPAFADRFHELLGERFGQSRVEKGQLVAPRSNEIVHRWNRIAIDATGLDHTPPAPGESRIFGEQLGPGRSSRAMAIVHLAIFDAVNANGGRFRSLSGVNPPNHAFAVEAAVSQAAHDTLAALYPSQKATFDEALVNELLSVRNSARRNAGIRFGQSIAASILAMREGDGSEKKEEHYGVEYIPNPAAGFWRQDPISQVPIALGSHWGQCRPFVLERADQFRLPPPPALESAEYTEAYNEVKRLGGDGAVTPTERTEEQTFISTFWAYDGTPSLCAPPRLYNQIAVKIADDHHLNSAELARLLVLMNVALADSGMAAWDSKFYYDFWRPIGGIRESDPGTGPSGTGDGNAATVGDVNFMPLGAPASNLTGPNFTPPFPSYPSGHAVFGGALFEVLRRFFGQDNIAFTFVSDEFNGTTKDHLGNVRPYIPRSFTSFSQAEMENGQSRIYLGIHWKFDATNGITQGRQVADYVYEHLLTAKGRH